MSATIISIGTEITSGVQLDTNSRYLARLLEKNSITVDQHLAINDSVDALTKVLREALRNSGLVIMTGGLGPTADDITRHALAKTFGCKLILSKRALSALKKRLRHYGKNMPQSNNIQAMIPAGAQIIPNPSGTACGILLEKKDTTMIALPGVPSEMEIMITRLLPSLIKKWAQGAKHLRMIHCIGISEAALGQQIEDLMGEDCNPYVGVLVHDHIITVEITAQAANTREAVALASKVVRKIRRRLGNVVFGSDGDTLEKAVGKLLKKKNLSLAGAESCTGGLLGSTITDAPGSSAYFKGGIQAYANEIKTQLLGVSSRVLTKHGAVSEPVAQQMAEGVSKRLKTDIGLAITGIAGPDGGTQDKPVGLVYIAVFLKGHATVTKTLRLSGKRGQIKSRAVKHTLNLLRRLLLDT